jgi:hypothetical protein
MARDPPYDGGVSWWVVLTVLALMVGALLGTAVVLGGV